MSTPFLDKLNDFAQSIDFEFEDVNYGGCCPVAYAFAKHLQKWFPTKILVANYNWYEKKDADINEIRPKLKKNSIHEWQDNGIGFAHVLVEFTAWGVTYQLETEQGLLERRDYTLERHPILKGHLSMEDAAELANSSEGWNNRFDRDQLPKIYKKIDKFFRHNTPEMFKPLLSQ